MGYRYTMECYPSFKNNEILSLVETWVELEAIMLNEISQKKMTNTVLSLFYMDSKNIF